MIKDHGVVGLYPCPSATLMLKYMAKTAIYARACSSVLASSQRCSGLHPRTEDLLSTNEDKARQVAFKERATPPSSPHPCLSLRPAPNPTTPSPKAPPRRPTVSCSPPPRLRLPPQVTGSTRRLASPRHRLPAPTHRPGPPLTTRRQASSIVTSPPPAPPNHRVPLPRPASVSPTSTAMSRPPTPQKNFFSKPAGE